MFSKLKLAVVLVAGTLAMPGLMRADAGAATKAVEAAKTATAAADAVVDFAGKLEKAVAESAKSATASAVAKGAATTAKVAAADAVKAATAATAAAKAAKLADAEAAKSEGDIKAAGAAIDKAEAAVSGGAPGAQALAAAAAKAASKAAASAVAFAAAVTAAAKSAPAESDATGTAGKTEPKAMEPQTFSIPALPSAAQSGDSQIWLAVGTLLCLFLTVLVLALAGFRLNDATSSNTEAVEGLSRSLSGLLTQATTAKQRYDDARTAAANPPAPVATPQPAYRQENAPPAESRTSGTISRSDIVKSWEPPHVEPTSPTISGGPISGSWSRAGVPDVGGSGVVGDYLRVRASGDGREVDKFEANYHFIRISCVNFDDLRTNPNASLRFQEAQRGSLLLVNEGSQTLAFPWFATDLVQERDRLEGIFQYFDSGGANLRLTKPAVLDKQGANWVMRVPGAVQADV